MSRWLALVVLLVSAYVFNLLVDTQPAWRQLTAYIVAGLGLHVYARWGRL